MTTLRSGPRLAVLLIVAVLLLLVGYVAAGPYLTVRAIKDALQEQDASALAEEVDFPALRTSLKAQLLDEMVREAGPDVQASAFGAFALTMATGLVNGTVDAMVTPIGLGALMEGRALWRNTRDGFRRPATDAEGQALPPPQPWRDADYRYESPSRFTITTRDEAGKPLVFVLRRTGLQWRLADIRLPLGD
jgi:hypothetical protein